MANMTGARGNYSDGEILHGGDLNLDLTTLLANDAQTVLDVLAGNSYLVSGCALTNGASGMQVNVALGAGYDATGTRWYVGTQTLTLANGSASPRFDVVTAQTGTTTGTNPSTGNPTVLNTGSLFITQGTPAGLPIVPTLSQSTYAQVGYILVPPSATSILSCTIYSQTTSPNSQGPLVALPAIAQHIASSLLNTTVHGVQVGSGASQVPIRDASGNLTAGGYIQPTNGVLMGSGDPGSGPDIHSNGIDVLVETGSPGGIYLRPAGHGATAGQSLFTQNNVQVPALISGGEIISSTSYVNSSGGVYFGPNGPGVGPDIHSDGTNIYLETNGTGTIYFRPSGYGNNAGYTQVSGSGISAPGYMDAAGGYRAIAQPGSNGGGAVIATYDNFGRVYDSERLGGNGVRYGSFAPIRINNGQYGTFSVTFSPAFTGAPSVIGQIILGGPVSGGSPPIGIQYGFDLGVYNVTTSGCTFELGQTTGADQYMGLYWIAFGTE